MSLSPERKRKKKPSLKQSPVLEPTSESPPNPSLPDDLVVSCLARVSRLQYPTLSLVSKSFRSLLASPELYKTRSSFGRTESCIYVCLSFRHDPISHWYTLCRKPDRTLTTNKKKKKSSGYALAKLSTHHSRSAHWSGLVAVGSDIYNIGGPVGEDKEPSSSVSILDCRSNTWREGPSMLVKRNYPHANVIDGKIYVTGDSHSTCAEWMEVFDPKTQTWELVSTRRPAAEIPLRYDTISTSAGIDRKVYIFGAYNDFPCNTKGGRWESVGMEMSPEWVWFSYCVVGNVIYFYKNGVFKWYDTKGRFWRVLKGLKGLPEYPRYISTLAAYDGGKIAVFWDRAVASTGYTEKMIWCAVIVLERRSHQEIWGTVDWKEPVLKVPMSCRINHALAPTL